MATPVLKVITQYCSILIDDINLDALARENMPLYARRMWSYLQAAIPNFTTPSGMIPYLMGTPDSPKLVEPIYGSTKYIPEEDITENTEITLENGAGYELFCCKIETIDKRERVILTPTNLVTYNSETGTITFIASEENPIPKGTVFNMDFYTDGYFKEDLSVEIMRILGLCFQVVWQTRFNNDWLSNVSKVEDRSFSEQNRANKEKTDTERLAKYKSDLNSAMRALERNLAIRKTLPPGAGAI